MNEINEKLSPKFFRKTGKSVFFDSVRPNFTMVEEIFNCQPLIMPQVEGYLMIPRVHLHHG